MAERIPASLESPSAEATRHPVAAGCLRNLVSSTALWGSVEHGHHPDRHTSTCYLADCDETDQATSSSAMTDGRRSSSMARRRARATWLNTVASQQRKSVTVSPR